jgi:hypothetical protein
MLLGSSLSAAAIEPAYWKQRIFFIPYQPPNQERFAPPIEKVQLLVSRDGVSDWAVLQEAQPNVRGFGYHAPVDGEYWFALRTADRKGKLTPATITQPQLRVVVDTTPPALVLSATTDATGRVIVRYEARDIAIKPETLRVEVQSGSNGPWERLAAGPPDVSQPDRLVGQIAWKPPTAAGDVRFRGTLDDRAGNQGSAATQASLVGPLLSPAEGPTLAPSLGSQASPNGALSDRASATITKSPLEWPSSSPPLSQSSTAFEESPRSADPFAAVSSAAPSLPAMPKLGADRTPAQLVADGANDVFGSTYRPSIAYNAVWPVDGDGAARRSFACGHSVGQFAHF